MKIYENGLIKNASSLVKQIKYHHEQAVTIKCPRWSPHEEVSHDEAAYLKTKELIKFMIPVKNW